MGFFSKIGKVFSRAAKRVKKQRSRTIRTVSKETKRALERSKREFRRIPKTQVGKRFIQGLALATVAIPGVGFLLSPLVGAAGQALIASKAQRKALAKRKNQEMAFGFGSLFSGIAGAIGGVARGAGRALTGVPAATGAGFFQSLGRAATETVGIPLLSGQISRFTQQIGPRSRPFSTPGFAGPSSFAFPFGGDVGFGIPPERRRVPPGPTVVRGPGRVDLGAGARAIGRGGLSAAGKVVTGVGAALAVRDVFSLSRTLLDRLPPAATLGRGARGAAVSNGLVFGRGSPTIVDRRAITIPKSFRKTGHQVLIGPTGEVVIAVGKTTRRLNPLNPRALSRALRRVEGFTRAVKRAKKSLRKIKTI